MMSKIRYTLSLVILLVSSVVSEAQMNMDLLRKNRNLEVCLNVADAETHEAVSFASVYIIPQGDTTITDFTLTGQEGDAELSHVPAGRYDLHIEMMGYKPFKKSYTFRSRREVLGEIVLHPDKQFIDAAKVSAAGNPVTVKKDTIEFNASSFKVGQNSMLEDLLKRMPGIEVDENGGVKMNGEDIKEITIEGKTFFFNDPTAAVRNLPAQIVDKIKVIDKDNEEAKFTGVSTKEDRQKVMDVGLKEQYKKGWFGNARLGGGATLVGKDANKLIDNRGALYNSNAMVSGYTEQDQIVFIGDGYNVNDSKRRHMSRASSSVETSYGSIPGLTSSTQIGANYNTSRIKGFDTNVSAKYRHSSKDGLQTSLRQSFQADDNNLYTSSGYSGHGKQDQVDVLFEIKKKEYKKYMFYFNPEFTYNYDRTHVMRNSYTFTQKVNEEVSGLDTLNRSFTKASGKNKQINTRGHIKFGVKELGKENRSITLNASYQYSHQSGDKRDSTIISKVGTAKDDLQDLWYKNSGNTVSARASLSYVEPFGDKWSMMLKFSTMYKDNNNNSNAFNADGSKNDVFSSFSGSRYMQERGMLLAQFKTNKDINLQFGVQALGVNNKNRSKTRGNEKIAVTGGDWQLNWAPFVSFDYRGKGHSVRCYYEGQSSQVSGKNIVPILDISNPSQVTTGNIYLKPIFYHEVSAGYSMNNPRTFSFLRLYVYDDLELNTISNAIWFDQAGIRYSVPVNSKTPANNLGAYFSLNQPFGRGRHFTLQLNANVDYSNRESFQASNRLPGIDIVNFDYDSFMQDFWGNAEGDRFYNGESGFSSSKTRSLSWSVSPSLKYTHDLFEISLGGRTRNAISKYSLDSMANTNTWNSDVYCSALITPGMGWEVNTRLDYKFYNGYIQGYGDPEWQWDMSLSKSIKMVTLTLKVNDILNQTRNLRHTVNAEYVEDVYSNIMGRYLLFSVSFNFGKMNAAKNRKVESAMWNMM